MPEIDNRIVVGKPREPRNRRSLSDYADTVFLGLSLILFFSSLTQTAFVIGNREPWIGAICLLWGWTFIPDGVVAWLANPFLLIAWTMMCIRDIRLGGFIAGLIALGLCLSFFIHSDLAMPVSGPPKITRYGIGYWLWLDSIVTALLGCIVGRYLDRRSSTIHPPLD